jgi:serine protease AprX
VTSPCNSPKVITVGAINDHNTEDPSDDGVTTFSSRGPTRFDLLAKPDLLAPGNRIVSLRSAGSTLDTLFPERRRAGDPDQPALLEYYEMSGTSMSSPIVAGAAALMLQQEPWLTPATIKARLMLSARKPAAGNPFATGAGMLDIAAALATTGDVADAPSPHVYPDPETGRMGFENTAVSWGNPAFSLSALWSPSVMWAAESADTATLWSDGCLWPDSLLWPDANLWPDSLLWPDATLWSEAVLWPDEQIGGGYIPDVGEAQQVLVDDPS